MSLHRVVEKWNACDGERGPDEDCHARVKNEAEAKRKGWERHFIGKRAFHYCVDCLLSGGYDFVPMPAWEKRPNWPYA